MEQGLAWQAGIELSERLFLSHIGIFSRWGCFVVPFLCMGHIPFAQQSATCAATNAPASGAAYVPTSVRRKTKLMIRRSIEVRS